MFIYNILAIILVGISHLFLYFYLIRYNRISNGMTIVLSILFTCLLGFVVFTTGYPEFNFILLFFFLLCLGLMQVNLTFTQNLFFTLASMVSITLVKIILMEIGMMLFMWSPLNLYMWTTSIIHFIVTVVIFMSIILLRKSIQRFAQYIVQSRIYSISFICLIVGSILIIILTSPSSFLLAKMYQQYGHIGYIAAIILFFILLFIALISSHLAKQKLIEEQQARLDQELLDYVEKLEVMHDELASFRHDYMNVLLTLDQAVRTKNVNQIEQIYHDVIAPTSKVINHKELDIVKLSHIDIPEVKSLLSVKLIDAQQQKIDVMIDIPAPITTISLPIVTFIRIISILIDNGIEAAVQSRDKTLQLAFFEIEKTQYFIVCNSTDQQTIDLEKIYLKRYSSKNNHRGYGLYALKQMMDKTANVTLETSFTHPLFTQTMIIQK